ncbi:MAG TPA: BTAD domain-containing putative transcriptional regulator [Actinomycetota bacterium]|nr:BTAD domain-containing putative transcriptional regulator [Actinomycetota bacterium]
MDFRVLGPLEVSDDTRRISLGGPKQRAVLAYLLTRVNQPVSPDRLIDELWREHATEAVRNTLQSHISHLRKALGAERITTGPAGYALKAEPQEVDALRFERLVADARKRHADDPDAVASTLEEALSLWRGPALADVADEPSLAGEITRLEELRLTALEDRLAADLGLGRHRDVIPELEVLVARHPLRERLWAHLMLALYRSGRQADALSAFGRARRTLVEEIGVDPSSDLIRLHERILAQDPALDLPDRSVEAAGAAEAARSNGPELGTNGVRSEGAPSSRRSRLRWFGRRFQVASVTFVVVALIVPIVVFGARHRSSVDGVPPNSIGVIDPETGRIVRSIGLPNAPGSMAAGPDAVWVTAPDDGKILRIDVRTESVVDSTRVGSAPAGIAVGPDAVWVVDSAGPALIRVSPQTNEVVATIPVGNGPVGVAAGPDAVWVTNRIDGTVSRVDPVTNEVIETIPVGDGPTGIAPEDEGVWVANSGSGTVVQLDADTNTVDRFVNVGNQPGPIAVGPDGIWVGNTLDATVSRIDTTTGAVVETVPVGLGPTAIAFVGNDVWVANEFAGTVSRLGSGKIATIVTQSAPRGAAPIGEALWVSVRGVVTSHRGGTLRLVSGGPSPIDSIDPVDVRGPYSILTITNDGLVGYRRVGGQDGLSLVPDLALSIPRPTDGGTTYRFRLREGIRYSTGAPVLASDFRRALERGLRIKDSYVRQYFESFPPLVGVHGCRKDPASCDLSEGIQTDDVEGTITFHLTESDTNFLYKLALPFAYAVPPGTPPAANVGTTPVPATGPYMIDEYMEDRIVLVRNPEYREWSAPAQPDGYPDRIVVTGGLTIEQQIAAVETGRADAMPTIWQFAELPTEQVESLITRYAGRIHLHPERSTFWLSLNASVPPFDDARARRAVSLALNRATLVDLFGGPQRARATCQFLPPNVQGYEPYCPYTLDPNPAGQWSAPDLDRARRLMRASGTRGDTVDFWPHPETPPSVVAYVASVLEELGYRVRLTRPDDPDRYFDVVLGSPDRVDVATIGWVSDYPAAADFFFGAPQCEAPFNPFAGAFCDPELDETIRRAERATDPQTSNALWASADRRLVDLAPVVPTVNPIGLTFVSDRVGNYQYSPQWGLLLGQLWVR